MEQAFAQGNSFLHRADPRAKVISTLFMVCAIAVLNRVLAATAAFFIACIFLYVTKLPPMQVVKRLFVVNAFIAFLWLFLPFSVPGRVFFSIWRWHASIDGIKMAVLITLRCNAILIIIITFIETTLIPILALALSDLRVPDKLIFIMLISYRYINVIFQEYNRLLQAARIRGFVPKNDIRTYKTYAYMVAMVLIRSYERGIRVHQAMILRGFNGKFYSLHRFHLQRKDIFLTIGAVLFVVFILYVDHMNVMQGL